MGMDSPTKSVNEAREHLKNEVYLMLGGNMIEIELDSEHYDLAISNALQRYRQRSKNATEEAYVFIEVQPEQQVYTLPEEIIEVQAVYRRGIGATAGSGAQIDPFALSYYNNLYMLPSGGQGNIQLFDFAAQYQNVVSRLFGRNVNFRFYKDSNKIEFHRRFLAHETFLLKTFKYRPDNILILHNDSRTWVREYAIAQAKFMLGEARSLYAQLPGPGGGITLNGETLKNEAKEELQRLDEELIALKDNQDEGYGFFWG